MSHLLFTETHIEVPNVNERSKINIKLKIKELILNLLSKERAQLNKQFMEREFDWGSVDMSDVDMEDDLLQHRGIFSKHHIPKLYPVPIHIVTYMREHQMDLKALAQGYAKMPQIHCKFCDFEVDSVSDLRLHMLSRLHDERVKYFTD